MIIRIQNDLRSSPELRGWSGLQASVRAIARRTNAKQMPQIYAGLHMAPGVADYEEGGGIQRILVTEDTIRRMNPTFAAKPLYVLHQETVMDTLHEDADGYVIKSFFNDKDGMTWAWFLAATDAAHEAVRNGWRLSNSYIITDTAGGGRWHNVPYDEEVTAGIFEHLALVPNPRYEESVVYTPENFAAYNERKGEELRTLQNSKKENKPMFKLFQKRKVTNADQLSTAVIELDDGTTVPMSRAIRLVAEAEGRRKKNSKRTQRRNADGDTVGLEQEITVGDKVMTIRELVQKFLELQTRDAENASDDDEDDDEKDKDKKRNAKRRRAVAAAVHNDDDASDDDADEDEEEADDADLAIDTDHPLARALNSRNPADQGGDEGETEDEDDAEGDDSEDAEDGDEPGDQAGNKKTNARGRAPAKNRRKNGKRNQRDAEGGIRVRVSPVELRLLNESRRIHADSLRNARDTDRGSQADGEGGDEILETSIDQARRGQERYGSSPAKERQH